MFFRKLATSAFIFSAGALRVQEQGESAQLPAEFNASRLAILNNLQSNDLGDETGVDCAESPHMCQSPFHCESWSNQDTLNVKMHGLATNDQHANLRSWCLPGLEKYANTVVKECLVNNNKKASAKAMYQQAFKDYSDELDASYCFLEGHCNNAVVHDNTSLFEMETICDYRFTRKGWSMNFLKAMKRLMTMKTAFSSLVSTKTGFRTQRLTRHLSKMACAQGIFHCDVMYCKHTYCRDEYYVNKYSHLLPTTPHGMLKDVDHHPGEEREAEKEEEH